jgi:hypothetical protein
VLSLEDVLIHRLHEFVATGHADVAEQAAALVTLADIDRTRLERRAAREGLVDAVVAIDGLARRSAAGGRIETWELHEIAGKLRSATLDR